MKRSLLHILALISVLLFFSGCVPSEAERVRAFEIAKSWLPVFAVLASIVGSVVAAAFIAQLVINRWKLVVFITYQHDAENIAKQVAEYLERNNMRILFLAYQPRGHDATLEEVRSNLRKSHLVLTIPGHNKSFVDAEILAASVLKRPIVFIKLPELTTLPDTAFEGYPVLDATKLASFKWVPLARFCYYVGNHWTDVLRNIQRAIVEVVIYFLVGIPGLTLLFIFIDHVGRFIGYFNFALSMWIQAVGGAVYYSLFTLTVLIIFPLSIVRKFVAIRVAKQTIISGRCNSRYCKRGLAHSPATRRSCTV